MENLIKKFKDLQTKFDAEQKILKTEFCHKMEEEKKYVFFNYSSS